MARVRSPNYPNISLAAALDRIRKIHAVEGTNVISRESFVEMLGYSGLTGPSAKILSSLGKYGLITKTGSGEVKISELAMDIMFGEPKQKNEALVRAANMPSLFAEINEKWPNRPPTDENLGSFLARKGFSIKVLKRVIAAYRDTIILVSGESADYDSSLNQTEDQTMQEPSDQPADQPPPQIPNIGMRVSFMNDRLEVNANLMDATSVDRLISVLEANKPLLPENTEKEESAGEQDVADDINESIPED